MESKNSYIRSIENTKTLMKVAQGKFGADLALVNANVLNVYTGELLNHHAVCVWKKWIAYVGESPDSIIQDNTLVMDVEGKTIIPGLIDGHTHLAWLATPAAFMQHALTGGTTAIITETLEPYPVSGIQGVLDLLEAFKGQPIKVFSTAPPMVSTSNAAKGISVEDLNRLLDRDDIIGLGETYWQGILQEPDRYLASFESALKSGKTLEGHTAGASEKKLMGYLTAGISSCHEPITAQETLDRLRLGIYVMAREGSIRRDLEAISNLNKSNIDLRRLILVSDGLTPGELIENGYMEFIVQKAIDLGFDPISAIQMATINVAEHFRLDHLIGGIAPGRLADLVVIPNEETIQAECVISNGKIIAKEGKLLASISDHQFSKESRASIRISEKVVPENFKISAPEDKTAVHARVIQMVTDLVTQEHQMELPCENGLVLMDLNKDILKVAAIDRTHTPGKTFTGLIHGFGLSQGAMACSAAWDTTDIIIVGTNEADMATAANRISELQGGAVFCRQGEILEELPLPIFGIMSDLPLEKIDKRIRAFNEEARRFGVPFPDPLLSLITLTGAAIPFIRICEEGLVDLKTGRPAELIIAG